MWGQPPSAVRRAQLDESVGPNRQTKTVPSSFPIGTNGRIVLLSDLVGNGNRRRASPLEMRIEPMTFKRNLVFSLLLALAGGLSAYALAWGLFTTHPELGIEPARGRA